MPRPGSKNVPFPAVDTARQICSHNAVKYAFSLVLAVSVLLASCNTLANRRSLYSPTKQHGPWTKKSEENQPPPPKRILSAQNMHS